MSAAIRSYERGANTRTASRKAASTAQVAIGATTIPNIAMLDCGMLGSTVCSQEATAMLTAHWNAYHMARFSHEKGPAQRPAQVRKDLRGISKPRRMSHC